MSDLPTANHWTYKWLPAAAAIFALAGLFDAAYLTVHHLTNEPVPCSVTGGGCEAVLTSPYAELMGIPLAVYGAAAYFTAFCLAVLTIFGRQRLWTLYGALSACMAATSFYLLYLQSQVIGQYCQYCLVSAATSITLFLIFLIFIVLRPKR